MLALPSRKQLEDTRRKQLLSLAHRHLLLCEKASLLQSYFKYRQRATVGPGTMLELDATHQQ